MAMIDGVPLEAHDRSVPCRFPHEATAVARFSIPGGCACYPGDVVQDLCVQHAISAEPLNGMQAVAVYDVERWALLRDLGHTYAPT